jgi:hypothetical protein
MDWLSKVIEFLKLPIRHIWACAIVTGGLLFLPVSLLSKLHLTRVVDSCANYIGALFLMSTVLACLDAGIRLWKHLEKRQNSRQRTRQLLAAMACLDGKEKAVLREYVIQGQNTIRLPIDHPIVAGLLAKGIIVQIGELGERSLAGMLFSVALADDVRNALTLRMLGLPEGEPSAEDITFARENRPEFMAEIDDHIRVFHTTSWRVRGM